MKYLVVHEEGRGFTWHGLNAQKLITECGPCQDRLTSIILVRRQMRADAPDTLQAAAVNKSIVKRRGYGYFLGWIYSRYLSYSNDV